MDQQTANADSLPKALRAALHFSVHELLLAVAALSALLAGYSAARKLGASAVALLVGIALCVVGRRYRASRYTAVGLFITIPSFCIFSLLLAVWFVFGVGPVFTRQSWPAPLTRMVEIAATDVPHVRVACLENWLDTQYTWRIAVEPERMDEVAAEFGLSKVSSSDLPDRFRSKFPLFWRPTMDKRNAYFIGADIDGEYAAIYSPSKQYLYVWYWFDF